MLHDSELNIDEKTKNRIEFLENHLKGQDARIEKLEKLLLDLKNEILNNSI
jgi:hypothetical protein